MKKSVAALALLAAMPMASNATEVYGGLGVGYADVEETTFGNCVGCINDDDISWQVLAGWQLSDAVAAEVAYVDFGSFKSNDGGEGKLEVQAIQVSAVGRVPVAKGFNLFGRVGIAYLDNTFKFPNSVQYNDHSQDLMLGGGLDWDVMDHVRVRVEGTWYDDEDTSQFNNFMLSGIYSFDL